MSNVKTSLENENQPSCLGAVMPSIYSMKLHDVIALTPTSIEGTAVSYFSIMRVAGGWIYQTWDTEKQEYIRETFVPFNNEFMSVFLSGKDKVEQFQKELKLLLAKYDAELTIEDFSRDWSSDERIVVNFSWDEDLANRTNDGIVPDWVVGRWENGR
jgi:hypothetical protein